MANYLNPEAIRPKYGWQPQGALAGMAYTKDRQRYEDTASLQDLMMMLEAAKAQEEQVQGAPVRQAERSQKRSAADLATLLAQSKMNQPGYGQALARGAMGEAGQQEAAGGLALGTNEQKIKAMNLENLAKIAEQRILQQRLGQSENPFETLVQSPQHIRDMSKTGAEVAGREKVAGINAGASRYSSDRSVEAAKIAAEGARDRIKESEAQRKSAVFKVLSQARTPADLGENQGLLGEGMRFIDSEINGLPAIAPMSQALMLGQISPQQLPGFQERLNQALEKAWDNRTAGMPLLNQVNPYKKKAPPAAEKGNTGISGVIRLD